MKEKFVLNISNCNEEFKKRLEDILEERGLNYYYLKKDILAIDYYPYDVEFCRAKVLIEWLCEEFNIDWYDDLLMGVI